MLLIKLKMLATPSSTEASTSSPPTTEGIITQEIPRPTIVSADRLQGADPPAPVDESPNVLNCRGDTTPLPCGDHTDELYCPDKRCDGKKECSSGEDEQNCTPGLFSIIFIFGCSCQTEEYAL